MGAGLQREPGQRQSSSWLEVTRPASSATVTSVPFPDQLWSTTYIFFTFVFILRRNNLYYLVCFSDISDPALAAGLEAGAALVELPLELRQLAAPLLYSEKPLAAQNMSCSRGENFQ